MGSPGEECVRKRWRLLLGSSFLGWRNAWLSFYKDIPETSESKNLSLPLCFWPTWQTDWQRQVVLPPGRGWCRAKALLSCILAKEIIINVLWFRGKYIQMLEITLLELATRMSHHCFFECALGEEWDTRISGGGDRGGDNGFHSSLALQM